MPRLRTSTVVIAATAPALAISSLAAAQSRTLVGRAIASQSITAQERDPHLLYDGSLFAVAEARPRVFRSHDLIQIVVQERSRSALSQEFETSKDSTVDGGITAFPRLSLADIAQLQLFAGRTANLPAVGMNFNREFEGEGEYSRTDDFSTRITAQIVEVLPNGNLVLEARTSVRNDGEISTIVVTGVCRGADVSSGNTVLSNQMYDLRIEKQNEGQIPEANEKGVITQVFEFLFAF